MKHLLLLYLIFSVSIRLFAQTEQPIKTWTLAKSSDRDNTSLLFTPSGFLIVGDGKDVRMLNTQSSKDVWLRGHDKDVHLLSLNQGGKQLLSASTGNEVKLWDLATFKEIPIEDYGKKEKKGGKVWNIVREGVQYLPNSKAQIAILKAETLIRSAGNVSEILRPKDRKFNPLKALGFAL